MSEQNISDIDLTLFLNSCGIPAAGMADVLFEKCRKDTVILFFENSDDAYSCENAARMASDTLKSLGQYGGYSYADMYIFHPADRWTYVRTHERSLGPYYCEKTKSNLPVITQNSHNPR